MTMKISDEIREWCASHEAGRLLLLGNRAAGMSVDIVSPADAVFRCIGTAGMSQKAVEHEGDVSRGTLSIINRRRQEGNSGLQMYMRTFLRVAHACGYRVIIATGPGEDADAFELGEETLQ